LAAHLVYRDDELLEKALQLQKDNPLFTEGAICGLLGVGREYIADRSKKSESILALRSRMDAIREGAWVQLGTELITRSSKQTNPLVYIWMTRNILGWRNEPEQAKTLEEKKSPTLSYPKPEKKPT